MASEQIIIEYIAQVEGMKAQLRTVQTELKNVQSQSDTTSKSTTEGFKKTETAAVSLKTQLRQLKEQLANATDPKDIARLAQAAGQVQNKLEDATKAAKAFSSESKFENARTALSGMARSIVSLDFKQAAVQSNLLLQSVKSITFKESLSGLKDLGTSLLNVGKALLSNPIFLIGGAIAGIIFAYKEWSDAEEANKKVVIDANREKLKSLKEFSEFEETLAKSSGATDSAITKQKIENLQLLKAENIAEKNRILEDRDDLNEEQIKRITELQDEEVKLDQQLKILLASQQNKATNDFLASEKKRIDDKHKLEKEEQDNLNKINKDKADNAKKFRDDENKKIADAQKEADRLTDIDLKNLEKDADLKKKLSKDVSDAEINATEDAVKEADRLYDEDVENKKKTADKKEAIRQAEFDLASTAANAIFEYQNQLDDAQIANLDDSLKRGTISQQTYDRNVADIKLKAAKRDKAQAAFNIALSTAEAIIKSLTVLPPAGEILAVIAATTGAVQLAAVLSKPLPEFAEGVIDLKGGVRGKDSIVAMLMPGESVMTTAETERHGDLLRSIRSNKLDNYLMDNYINPKLSAILGNSTAENMAKSVQLNGLDEYALARVMSRNKGVNLQNADYLASKIASEISKKTGGKTIWS